ncbi:MAG TPA: hypothetical protein VF203_05950 [Burkholderiales bacterium]
MRTLITLCLLGAFAALAAGCSGTESYGQYAEAKQGWDTPRPDDLDDRLRNRLAHTQRDS